MTTTTHITNIAHLIDLTPAAGDHAADFDMEAVNADFLARLNADLGAISGGCITVAGNGDVYAEPNVAGAARQIDYKSLAEGVDTETIWEQCARPIA